MINGLWCVGSCRYIYPVYTCRLTILCFLLFMTVVEYSYAQQYQFQNLSVGDGLAQSQVFCLLEDSRGYVWMGTRGGGVSRYDGERFETFTTRDGLRSNYIWCFAEDRHGTVWIGTEGGLCCYRNGRMDALPELVHALPVTSLYCDGDGVLMGSPRGLYSLLSDEETMAVPKTESMGLVMSILSTRGGQEIWFAGDNGIARKVLNGYQPSITAELSSPLVRALTPDSNGGIWIGMYGGGVNYWTGEEVIDMNAHLQLEGTRVHDIIIGSDGLVWIATQLQGVCRFNPKDSLVDFITEDQGLANNHVRALMEDRWGNVWIGTSGGGVSKYTGEQFRYFSTRNGLKGNYIYHVGNEDGVVQVATSGPGLCQWREESFETAPNADSIPARNIKAVLHDRECRIWYGLDGAGIAVVDTDTIHLINGAVGLAGNYVRDLVEDMEGNVWAALSGGGISKVTLEEMGYRIKNVGTTHGLSARRINKLHIDQWGRLWFAALNGGVGHIQDDTVRALWSRDNGLSSNDATALLEDVQGHLWVGTAGKGLNRLSIYEDSVSIAHWGTEEGLSSDICYLLLLDPEGQLWVGSEKGVDRLRLDEEGEVIDIRHFGMEEGFQGVETTLNAACVDDEGHLWFGTINGLIEYSGEGDIARNTLPVLGLNQVNVNTRPVPMSDQVLALSHDSNMVSFAFRAITQNKARSLVYQWRLTGLDEDWNTPANDNNVTYSNLRPGDYTFEVRASTDLASWTEPKRFSFAIATPYWETWWFILSAIGIGVLIVSLMVAIRVQNIKRKARKQQEQLQLEKEVLELEQKALRLQMNPHFIFNALNTIQAMISTNDAKTARYFLAKFSKLMRQILDNSRQQSITLEREIETLQNYLAIEQFCHGNRFDYDIEVDEELDQEDIQLPPIVLQPFVENAIVHGVSQKEGDGRITIGFRESSGYLVCTVEDNGIGRQAAEKAKSQRDQKHKSAALLITQERLDNLNQQEHRQSIEIKDLEDAQGNPAGTRVVVRIALGQ